MKHTNFFLLTLLLGLLTLGSTSAWGAFTQGATYYVDLRTVDFYKDGAVLLVNFYNGSNYLGDGNRAAVTETAVSHVYSFTIPNITTDNFKIVRLDPNNLSNRWNQTVKMYENAAGDNNCINLTSWPSGDVPCSWTTYDPGSAPTPSGVTYDGSEIFYFHKKGGSLDWGTIWDNNCALYLQFSNANESSTARSSKIGYFWDADGTGGDVLATRVPAGTWSKVKILRTNNNNKNEVWNQSNYVNLEEGKDYLNNSNTMAVYSPRTFHFYISGSTALANTGSDFNAWNGNGTAHSGSMTKLLDAGTYKFKLNPTGTVDWRSEFNMDDIDQSNSNITLYDGNNKEIWFDLAAQSEVTIACDGNGVTVNAVTASTPTPSPSSVTYDGSEIFYFHKKGGSLNWGSVWADDCALFLLFSNADESLTARSTKVGYFWDTNNTSGDVLATRVPAGTWSKVKVIRTQNENRNNVWNESNYVTLEEGKNYLNDNNTMAVYSPRTFHFYISGSTALANTGSDFNAWNGNGTAHSGSIEKLLEAGTYKFKLNPTGTVDWRSEFNTDDLDAVNSSNNINLRNGNNKEIWFDLSAKSNVTITCNGSKVTVVAVPVQQYTVTFNSNGGSAVAAQSVSDGSTATAPDPAPTKDGYTFVKWQKNGADYSFSTPVTADIQLDAVWAYKAISGVSLNESEHTTWVGNSDFTLTPTIDPSDLIAKSVVWSSNAEGVATVSNGIVHAVAAGEAVITCTVTDQYDTQRSASCTVTVAACEMTTENLYSMTVTGYNSSTGDDATLTGLWNSSEPATITICNVRIGNEGTPWYAYDNNGTVMIEQRTSDDVDKWQMIATGTANVYYLKNISTGKYMYCGATNTNDSKGNGWTSNGDWLLRSVYTSTVNGETDSYKFYLAKDNWNNDVIVSRADASNGAHPSSTDFVLSRQQLTGNPGVWSNVVANTVSASRGATQGGNTYKGFQSSFVNIENIANPAYIPSQMNSDYYRMNTNATVQANLAAALVKGAVITVSLYADAATSVKLEKTDGTEIATINLNADAALEYSYTVNAVSALLGQSAFVIKAADNHAAIASIAVARTYAASPSTPDLVWESDLSSGVSQSVMAGNFVHTASSSESSGAISYSSSDPTVATVASDGTVTPKAEGTTTITATIEEAGCYAEHYITYDVTLTGATLAELIAANSELTLQYNYNEDAVINKTITIDGNGHSIGNLTIETAGDLTLTGNLTVKDFTICAKAGNTSNPAASGQVRNANHLTSIGNAYFLYTVDPSGTVHYGWYDFTVPFPVNVMTGIKGIQNEVLKENFANEVDYAIMEYLGDKQAQGQYPYKKFRGVMQPNKLYSITLDNDYNYNTVRFQKTSDGALVASNSVTLNEYLGDGTHDNWNGVGNGTLHHADAGVTSDFIQVYQNGDKSFLAVPKNEYSLVVGSAFMVQETGSMMLNQATHSQLLAPSRATSTPAIAVQIAREGQPFSDQLFISASETGGQTYTQGIDLAKAGDFGKANVPQIGTNAYNTLLCVHEAQLIGGQAQYALSLYAPANGTYMLTSKNIPEDKSIYLTQNGNTLCNLSDSYALDLTKGITTEYGLLLVETHKVPTDVDNVQSDNVQSTKIIRNGMLYILRNGEIFNAQGARVQ